MHSPLVLQAYADALIRDRLAEASRDALARHAISARRTLQSAASHSTHRRQPRRTVWLRQRQQLADGLRRLAIRLDPSFAQLDLAGSGDSRLARLTPR
jgi:hypothetical protein